MSHLLDMLLDPERLDEIQRDEAAKAQQSRVLRGEPYIWAQVPWRSDTPARRRGEPRASRFGDLI